MDSALLLLKTIGISPNDGRWMHCEAFAADRGHDDYPIVFKCDAHGVSLTKIPRQGESSRTTMTVNFAAISASSQKIDRQSSLELYLTDDGPKIQAKIYVCNQDFDFILSRFDLHNGRMFFDFTLNIDANFTYSDGNVWNFPEFPASLNLRVARRSGRFEIERWSASVPFAEF